MRYTRRGCILCAHVDRECYWTEATVHHVAPAEPDPDKGALVWTRRIPIEHDDTVEKLQQRVLPIEHEVVISALQAFANGTSKSFERREPLVVGKSEEEALAQAKTWAIQQYPNG